MLTSQVSGAATVDTRPYGTILFSGEIFHILTTAD